jgi:type IX secretion system PorP/SprF family membrane protein
MRKVVFFVFLLLVSFSVNAQQEAMYTHYMYNTLGVNPAYAGSRDALTITALHRSQWVGFDGAPITQTITIHSPVFSEANNLGFSLINDVIGPVHATGVYVDYAFRFHFTEKSRLALGLKVGFNSYGSALQTLKLNEPDHSFTAIESTFSPNVGFGVYYTRDNFYAGLSTPKLFENNYLYTNTNSVENVTREARHYYFIVGGLVHLAKDVDLKPTSFIKIVNAAPNEADFTANFILYDQFTVGAMYRTGDALGLLMGYDITEQFNVGYSFDWSFVNSTGKYNYGSHEILLRYDFIYKNLQRIRSPRYF